VYLRVCVSKGVCTCVRVCACTCAYSCAGVFVMFELVCLCVYDYGTCGH